MPERGGGMRAGERKRGYHAPRWSEPIIMEMGSPGERGVIPPNADDLDIDFKIPESARRKRAPKLPEMSQLQVLRHFEHLAQETLGMESSVDISEGTCTMKYSPKVNERLVEMIKDTHPWQDEETIQGILEIIYKTARLLCEISGMDEFSFQAGGGAHAVYENACIVRKYFKKRGEEQRNEIISTAFSHPVDWASPATAGFKIISLYPDEDTGLPDIEALKAAVSERTAALFITNPEDTGIFNPEIDEYTKIVHEAGGLCQYDQANANVLLGITRAKEAGFDMCFFNLHKTFSSPHGSQGPACGAVGVTEKLSRFLPVPVVTFDGERYHLDYDRPDSIGKVKEFFGNVEVVLRAYAWIMSMGAEGLKTVAETSAINQAYLQKKLLKVRGVSLKYEKSPIRLDQARWSLEEFKNETGLTKEDFNRRFVDYGMPSLWYAHPPELVPEPFTPEPCESYSKEDIDLWVESFERVIEEGYRDPSIVKNAPHNSTIHRINPEPLNDPKRWAMTWRAYLKKREEEYKAKWED